MKESQFFRLYRLLYTADRWKACGLSRKNYFSFQNNATSEENTMPYKLSHDPTYLPIKTKCP